MKTDRAREDEYSQLSFITDFHRCDRCGTTRWGHTLWSHGTRKPVLVGFYCFACLDGSEP